MVRKIRTSFEKFLKTKRKTSFFILVLMIFVTSIAIMVSKLKILAAITFGFSIVCFIRLITYKTGKIPFISIDKTWQRMRLKYSQEEAEEKYKEMSIKSATDCFVISVFSFIVWVVSEVIVFI